MIPDPFLVAGRWVTSSVHDDIASPFDGRLVRRVCRATPEHLEQALAAADAAAPTLAALSPARRAEILEVARQGVTDHRDALVAALVDEAGKPVTAARGEVDRCLDTFTDAAWAARSALGSLEPLDALNPGEGRVGLVARVPVGPVAAITPFNFPLNLVAHKLAPAIAAGCPVILKPAPQTPGAALILGRILTDAGLPDGGLSVLPLSNEDAGPLSSDPRVRFLSFTGSAKVGWALKARAAHMRVALELGGNAGVYVAEDADLDRAVARIAAGGFGYAGQSCISVQRVYVHRSRYDAFVDALVAHVATTVRAGDPHDDDVTVGPVIRQRDAERIVAWVDEAVQAGATVRCGGTADGTLVAPTVLTGAPPDAKVMCEEVFGPVVTVVPVADDDEALRRLDDTAYGLQAAVFTRRVDLVLRAWRTLHVGGVIHDDASAWRVDLMPYGGTKDSGIGREGPRHAVLEYTEPRILVLRAD
ncbi:MAG: aldehyde dehydrogenase family protein [Alphaproteobacteria bacterium]|nr:aldehyde dehydrogenase family protein [Alphaproteobacteria bacterium]